MERTWEDAIEEAKAAGGKVITPNNLPIRSIKNDWTMLEHEDGDHPDYKFPIEIEFCGPEENDPAAYYGDLVYPASKADAEMMRHETHAVIYTDGFIVVTLYECCYNMFVLKNRKVKLSNGNSIEAKGLCLGGFLNKYEWKITEESLKYIKEKLKEVK